MEIKDLKKKHKKKIDMFKLWTKINSGNLDREIDEVSSKLFSVGLKLGEAELIRDKLKTKLKQINAKARLKWSKKKIKGKSLTIPKVDAYVDTDPDVMAIEELLNEANYVLNICKSAASSMKEKGQQLTNVANNRRAELNKNIRHRKK